MPNNDMWVSAPWPAWWPQGHGQRHNPPGRVTWQATWREDMRPMGLWQQLSGSRLTSDLTHHQRSKILFSLSESGWGTPIIGRHCEQEE
jgi:hypothetical protein